MKGIEEVVVNEAQKPVFVDAKHTLSLAITFLGIAFAGFTILGLTLFALLNHHLGEDYFEGILTLSILQEKIPVILLVGGVAQAIVLSLILLLLSLLWVHSIAGPLVRLGKYLKMMERNEPGPEIAFRQNDQLHALAQAFRQLQMSRQHRISQLHACSTEAARLVEKMDDSQSEAKEQLASLGEIYRHMKEIVSQRDNA